MNQHRDPDSGLREQFGRLPRSVLPERDLWAGIEQQITAQASPARSRAVGLRWAIAASVASLAVGALVTLMLQRPAAVQVAGTAVPSAVQRPAQGSMTPQFGDAGYSFVPASTDAVRARLRKQVAAQLAHMPPATREKVEKNLLIIKNAVADIQSALARDPDNALLQDLLVTTYQNELDTLANVQALASSANSEVST